MSDSSSSYNEWELEIDLSKGIESPIEILDNDVFFMILSFLNFADRIRIERVSHKWRKLSQESWCTVKKFDLSEKTWGILPVHREHNDCCDTDVLRFLLFMDMFCSKVLKKVLALSVNTLNDCDFRVGKKMRQIYTPGVLNSFMLPGGAVSDFFESCQNLKCLKIYGNEWQSFPLTSFFQLQTENLKVLDMSILIKNGIEMLCFREFLKKSLRLHTFKTEIGYLDPRQWENMFNEDALKSLTLPNCRYNNPGVVVECLSKFKNLEYCEVDLANMTDEHLKILTDNCTKLKSMILKGNRVTNKGLLQLTSLPDLQVLKILFSESISDVNLQYFSNLKYLHCLSTPRIEDDGVIKLLDSSPSLESLVFLQTGITARCFEAANDVVKKRTNDLPLKILADIPYSDLENMSPLLTIVSRNMSLLTSVFRRLIGSSANT